MLIFLSLISLFTAVWAQKTSPVLDPNKFTICAMTINSNDEKKIFQAQAAKYPKKFNPVVELTDFGDSDWFAKACSSGIRCDQLVISGHFGGEFFGESNKTLSLTELEKAGCSKTCEGVLNQPYEVFLFGCNTLAEKNEDHRTPAQYLQVLLQDGIPLARAEMVVQSRYGAVGDSNKAGMQRAFGGEHKQLYGFHSVGPSGKNVKAFINNYFTKISAPDQLEKQMAKRMMGKVDIANKALAESLKSTAFTQCASADSKDEKTQKVCKLLDARKSVAEKLDLTIELLGQEDYLLYLPAINIFMNEIKDKELTPEEQKIFDLIKNNKILKDQILGLINQTKGLGLKSEWMLLARNMGYLTQEETTQRLTQEVETIFAKPISESDVEIICSIDSDLRVYLKLADKNIKHRSVGIRELQAFSCLTPLEDAALVTRLVNAPAGNNPEMLNRQLDIATYSNVKEVTISPTLKSYAKKHLMSKEIYLAGEGLGFLAKFYPDDPDAIKRAFKFIEDSKEKENDTYYGYNALRDMRTKDPSVLAKTLAMLKEPGGDEGSLITFMANSKVSDPKIQQGFSELLNVSHIEMYAKERILKSLKEIKPSDSNSAVIEEVLKYAEGANYYYRVEALDVLKGFKLSPELEERVKKISNY